MLHRAEFVKLAKILHSVKTIYLTVIVYFNVRANERGRPIK